MIGLEKPFPVYEMPEESTSPRFARAFAAGCKGRVLRRYEGGRWSGFGSPQNWQDLQAAIRDGHEWYFGDHAYFQRHRFYRVTKCAYFHTGVGKSDMKRVRLFFNKPAKWQRGKKIILCPQSEGFFTRVVGISQEQWIKNVIEELRLYTDREIVTHMKRDSRPLADFFRDAHCIISHSSNSAVEAVMAGVPAINLADSPAAAMTRRNLYDVENLFFPENRLEWAAVLADNQWTLDEISNGDCWRHLNAEV